MSLKPCRECNQMVSTQATTCPHCGISRPADEQVVARTPVSGEFVSADEGGKKKKRGRALWWILGSFLFLVMCSIMTDPPREKETNPQPEKKIVKKQPVVSNITFGHVNRSFGVDSSLTDLQKDEEWKKTYRGKCVEWTGELAHLDSQVFGGFSVGMKHLQTTLIYDVLIDVPDSEKAKMMAWRQGQRYTYRATLRNYGGAILPISADWGCE